MKKRIAGNSGKTAKRGKPFKPGQSGNPNGRPKLSEEQKAQRLQAQAVLDAHTVDAAWAAVDLLQSYDGKLRVAALNSILDRADLKGTNRLQVTGADGGPVQFDLTKLSDAEARALNAALKKAARNK